MTDCPAVAPPGFVFPSDYRLIALDREMLPGERRKKGWLVSASYADGEDRSVVQIPPEWQPPSVFGAVDAGSHLHLFIGSRHISEPVVTGDEWCPILREWVENWPAQRLDEVAVGA